MVNKLIKKIWFICLWLASLALAGCFHVPEEDWLLSSNKTGTWDVKNDEMDEVLNSLMDWINMISSDWNDLKNNDKIGNGIIYDTWSELTWNETQKGNESNLLLQTTEHSPTEIIENTIELQGQDEVRRMKENWYL